MIMALNQETVDLFLKTIKQEDIDEMIKSDRYKKIEACVLSLESEPLMLRPAKFLVITHINSIRGFNEKPSGLEESTLDFLARTNGEIIRMDQEIKSQIAESKENKSLFDLLIRLMLIENKLGYMENHCQYPKGDDY
jgi:hypothetical protein